MAQPQVTLALPTLADRAFDAPPPLAPPPLYDRPNIRNSARGPEQVLEEGAVRCAHDHEKVHTRKRPRGQRAEHQRQVPRADAVGDDGIVERLAFPHERGHAVTLAPRADDLHSRGARSSWSEGSGDSTAAYATRHGVSEMAPPLACRWLAQCPEDRGRRSLGGLAAACREPRRHG